MKETKVKTKIKRIKILWLTAVSLLLLLISVAVYGQAETQNYNFKMISTIEYSGKGQYRSQAENTYLVTKESLPNDMVNYKITSTGDNSASEGNGQVSKEMGFTIDKNTRRILSQNPELSLLEIINNECVKNFTKISSQTVGKSWEQVFTISVPGYGFPKQIKFSLEAIGLNSKQNEMIAVRALSDTFTVNVVTAQGKQEPVKCKVNAVYLFDNKVEDIYLSVSAFDATTKMNGYDEKIRNEVATYRLGDDGKPVDLSGISKDFEKMVRQIGLKREELKVTKKVTLPQWISKNLSSVIETSNICAATACEGALNPVVTICAASAQTFHLQSTGLLASTGSAITVSRALAQAIPGIGGMKIAAAPAALMGMSTTTAGAVAGATAGGIAIAGGGGGGSSEVRSPTE